VVNLPDNHLQYAITWYGLAAALVGVFAAFAFGSRNRKTGEKGTPSRSL
jgi:surfeit locus 1 family protein